MISSQKTNVLLRFSVFLSRCHLHHFLPGAFVVNDLPCKFSASCFSWCVSFDKSMKKEHYVFICINATLLETVCLLFQVLNQWLQGSHRVATEQPQSSHRAATGQSRSHTAATEQPAESSHRAVTGAATEQPQGSHMAATGQPQSIGVRHTPFGIPLVTLVRHRCSAYPTV